jgi:hypothetical protein
MIIRVIMYDTLEDTQKKNTRDGHGYSNIWKNISITSVLIYQKIYLKNAYFNNKKTV